MPMLYVNPVKKLRKHDNPKTNNMFQNIKKHEHQNQTHTLSPKQLQNQHTKVKKTNNIKYIMDSGQTTKIERVEIVGRKKKSNEN